MNSADHSSSAAIPAVSTPTTPFPAPIFPRPPGESQPQADGSMPVPPGTIRLNMMKQHLLQGLEADLHRTLTRINYVKLLKINVELEIEILEAQRNLHRNMKPDLSVDFFRALEATVADPNAPVYTSALLHPLGEKPLVPLEGLPYKRRRDSDDEDSDDEEEV